MMVSPSLLAVTSLSAPASRLQCARTVPLQIDSDPFRMSHALREFCVTSPVSVRASTLTDGCSSQSVKSLPEAALCSRFYPSNRVALKLQLRSSEQASGQRGRQGKEHRRNEGFGR